MKAITKLIYDKGSFPIILSALGFKTNKKGMIVDEKTNQLFKNKNIKANKVIAVKKDKESNEPIFYTSESKLIGDMLNEKYGIFM